MIPRRIFALWLQGEKAAPPLVQMCLLRWRRLNPGWELTVLDQTDVNQILSDFPVPVQRMQPQALSDVLRVKLLAGHGGVWIDATTFPTAPLDNWISEAARSGFFAFEGHRPPLDVDSWFLAAAPGHVIPRLWWEEIERYWSQDRALISFASADLWKINYNLDPLSFFRPEDDSTAEVYPYYWVMYLFSHLLKTRPEFRAAWEVVERVSSRAAHAVQRLSIEDSNVSDQELVAASARSNVQKLSYKDRGASRWQRLDNAFEETDRFHGVSFDGFPVFEADEKEESFLSRGRHAAEARLRGWGGWVLRRVGARK